MAARVEVEGLGELIAQLRKIERDKTALKSINKEAAEIPLPDAKREAPKASGRLAKSGRVSGQQGAGVLRFGGAKFPYAGPAHFGDFNRPQGGFIRSTPFIFDAIDENERELHDHYERSVHEVVRDAFE